MKTGEESRRGRHERKFEGKSRRLTGRGGGEMGKFLRADIMGGWVGEGKGNRNRGGKGRGEEMKEAVRRRKGRKRRERRKGDIL